MTKVTSIRLPDDLVDRLDQIARSSDRPRGWVIRQALASYVQMHEAGETGTPGAQAARDEVEAGADQSTPLEKVIAALELMIQDAAERDPRSGSTDAQPPAP
jgi:predicted transcriptional regulator